jgi:hypothetical protein
MSDAKARRSKDLKRQNAVRKIISKRGEALQAAGPGIAGARLSIRALESDRDQRQKRLTRYQDRLVQLDSMIEFAQRLEDEAVESVADIQSWVDRSRQAIARSAREQESIGGGAKAPPVVPAASQLKVDKLLNRKKKRAAVDHELVPDPSAALDVDGAATVMFARTALNVPDDVDADAATAIFQRSPDTSPAVQASEEDEDEAATQIFSREELVAKLEAEENEEDGDRTIIVPRQRRVSPRHRKKKED